MIDTYSNLDGSQEMLIEKSQSQKCYIILYLIGSNVQTIERSDKRLPGDKGSGGCMRGCCRYKEVASANCFVMRKQF